MTENSYKEYASDTVMRFLDHMTKDTIARIHQAYFKRGHAASKDTLISDLVGLFSSDTPEELKRKIEASNPDVLKVLGKCVDGRLWTRKELTGSAKEPYYREKDLLDCMFLPNDSYSYYCREKSYTLPPSLQAIFHPMFVKQVPLPSPLSEDFADFFPSSAIPEDTVRFFESLAGAYTDQIIYTSMAKATAFLTKEMKDVQVPPVAESYGLSAKQALLAMLLPEMLSYRDLLPVFPLTTRHLLRRFFALEKADIKKENHGAFLPYLKLIKTDYVYKNANIHLAYRPLQLLHDLLGELETGRWYDAFALYDTFQSRSSPLLAIGDAAVIDEGDISLKAESVEGDTEPDFQASLTFSIRNLETETLHRPLFLAILYCLGMLGALSLHESPVGVKLPLGKKKGKLPFSPCDGLKAVRMTPFGRYLLGFTEEMPKIGEDSSSLVLDDELLVITYEGNDYTIRKLLASVAVPLGKDLFTVTEESFIHECARRSSVGSLIKTFTTIAKPLPPNWQKFLDDLKHKNEGFMKDSCTSYTVNDEVFAKLRKNLIFQIAEGISFATGNQIICKGKAVTLVERILEQYGYKNG